VSVGRRWRAVRLPVPPAPHEASGQRRYLVIARGRSPPGCTPSHAPASAHMFFSRHPTSRRFIERAAPAWHFPLARARDFHLHWSRGRDPFRFSPSHTCRVCRVPTVPATPASMVDVEVGSGMRCPGPLAASAIDQKSVVQRHQSAALYPGDVRVAVSCISVYTFLVILLSRSRAHARGHVLGLSYAGRATTIYLVLVLFLLSRLRRLLRGKAQHLPEIADKNNRVRCPRHGVPVRPRMGI